MAGIYDKACFSQPLCHGIELLWVVMRRRIHVEGIQANPLTEVVVAERNLLEISGGHRE
jgi:hypothetical protein